ncbi:hypothetical protein UFOVP116_262 [uncultured Caudovirales phage]|uniref:Uncharacterized protein n=1 Tax=uncultured Caudovirales phage TaxID=2100421 RepID=A0A6J5L7U6_9CAUD|nr:hypothetical protein UFOVP116_262 [uncultured Caudovirales phage]
MPEQTPNASPEVAFDRRAPHTQANWVRVALNEQNTKIEKVATDLENLTDLVAKAIPDNDAKAHYDVHYRLIQWEIRQKEEEARKLLEDTERRQFYTKIKQDIIQNALRAGLIVVLTLMVLGTQTKFKEWIFTSVAAEKTSQEVKK